MRVVYGPIRSLGLGKVIAVDPICRHPKVCNFNCIYCHLGHGGLVLMDPADYIDAGSLMRQVGECLHREECETVIFKGTGEPLLARNIYRLARELRQVSEKKLALMTNCSMLGQTNEEDLDAFDIIIAKLDAASEETFRVVNRPHPSIRLHDVLERMMQARERFQGSFRVQVTLVKENLGEIDGISKVVRDICPDYVYLDNPEGCDPFHQVTKRDMQAAMERFTGIRCLCSEKK